MKLFVRFCCMPSDSGDHLMNSLLPMPAVGLFPALDSSRLHSDVVRGQTPICLVVPGLLPLGTAQPGSCKHTRLCHWETGSHCSMLCDQLVQPAICALGQACTHLAGPR